MARDPQDFSGPPWPRPPSAFFRGRLGFFRGHLPAVAVPNGGVLSQRPNRKFPKTCALSLRVARRKTPLGAAIAIPRSREPADIRSTDPFLSSGPSATRGGIIFSLLHVQRHGIADGRRDPSGEVGFRSFPDTENNTARPLPETGAQSDKLTAGRTPRRKGRFFPANERRLIGHPARVGCVLISISIRLQDLGSPRSFDFPRRIHRTKTRC